MRIFDLALKDLSQMFRDRRSLLFVIAMPIVFTIFMGFAYSSASTNVEATDTRTPLAVVNPQMIMGKRPTKARSPSGAPSFLTSCM